MTPMRDPAPPPLNSMDSPTSKGPEQIALSSKHKGISVSQKKRPLDAPVFRPTEQEFTDPLKYISGIREEAQKAGICKIIPPIGWTRPEFQLSDEVLGRSGHSFRFRTRLQTLHSMDGSTRLASQYLSSLTQFHEQQQTPNLPSSFPYLTLKVRHKKVPLNLYQLQKHAQSLGISHPSVTKVNGTASKKDWMKWKRLTKVLGLCEGQESPDEKRTTLTKLEKELMSAYVKYIAPFEAYLEQEGLDENHSKEEEQRKTPTLMEFCHICEQDNDETRMLLCDGCNKGYHMYCLNPPLKSIPEGDWFCLNCFKVPLDDFGFEDSSTLWTLQKFEKMANKFKKQWFSRLPQESQSPKTPLKRNNVNNCDKDKVEEEFWRLATSPFERVQVEYGADLHSTVHGSGFPVKEKDPFNPHTSCPWNVNNIPVLSKSLLRHIKRDISGMMVPWLYIGMVFSTFCWHAEDHFAYSINYMHWYVS